MKLWLCVLLFLSGCASNNFAIYNLNDAQDYDCYAKFGGELGYCDLPFTK